MSLTSTSHRFDILYLKFLFDEARMWEKHLNKWIQPSSIDSTVVRRRMEFDSQINIEFEASLEDSSLF